MQTSDQSSAPITTIARRRNLEPGGPVLSSGVDLFQKLCDVTGVVDISPDLVASPRGYRIDLQFLVQSHRGGQYVPAGDVVEWASGPGASPPTISLTCHGSKVRLEADPKQPLPMGMTITVVAH